MARHPLKMPLRALVVQGVQPCQNTWWINREKQRQGRADVNSDATSGVSTVNKMHCVRSLMPGFRVMPLDCHAKHNHGSGNPAGLHPRIRDGMSRNKRTADTKCTHFLEEQTLGSFHLQNFLN